MVGPKYQAKIPPLGSYMYQQERGSRLERHWGHSVNTGMRLVSHLRTRLCCVSPAYSNEDQLLWTPAFLPVQEVEDFLIYAQRPHGQRGAPGAQAHGAMVPDNEQVMWEWYLHMRYGAMSSAARLTWSNRSRCVGKRAGVFFSSCSTFDSLFLIVLFVSWSTGTVWTGEMQLQCRGGAETTPLQCQSV